MRRVVFYLFYDSQGVVDEYVPHMLEALRPFAEHIFLVSNSPLNPAGLNRLRDVCDTVWIRPNVGFDVWAYRDAMTRFGTDRLAEYDELILMNHTVFGPVFPLAETFDAVGGRPELDFWGITAHGAVEPNPVPGSTGPLPWHIQSHWIAVRHRMFTSSAFQEYWQQMPAIETYDDAVLHHESRFTEHFVSLGFRCVVTFDPARYPAHHPVLDDAVQLLRDRCPIVKRRLFFQDSVYMDRNAILGRRVLEEISRSTYPVPLIWRNVVRAAEPRTLYTNMSLLSVLPDSDAATWTGPVPRIVVALHAGDAAGIGTVLSALTTIPVPHDVVVTTRSELLGEVLAALHAAGRPEVEVRVLDGHVGRTESAFLIGCRDILAGDSYDLVLKLHTDDFAQLGAVIGDAVRSHSVDNLLSSTGYVAGILRVFAADETVGMVFPPAPHVGLATYGHGWQGRRAEALDWAARLGIDTPLDRSTPLAPYGGMFWARPAALSKLVDHTFDPDDFAPQGGDSPLEHVLVRLYGSATHAAGYRVQSVVNADWVTIDHPFLENKLIRVAELMSGWTEEQIRHVQDRSGPPADTGADSAATGSADGPIGGLKGMLRDRYPRLGRVLSPGYRATRAVVRRARAVRGRT